MFLWIYMYKYVFVAGFVLYCEVWTLFNYNKLERILKLIAHQQKFSCNNYSNK